MSADGTELYRRYRPVVLEEVVGQPEAVKIIKGFGDKIPHALLFYGPSGTGKTTLARIVATRVGCSPTSRFDYQEINCGMVESALDTIRRIDRGLSDAAIGKCRVYVLDEVQSFSRAKFAQEAALKMLEDCPDHVYFALCTTDPKKIITTIRNRCTQIEVKALSNKDIDGLIRKVAKREQFDLFDRVAEKIVEVAAGSARAALVNLEKVIGIDGDERQQAAAVSAIGENPNVFELVKALLPWKGNPEWKTVADVLERIKEEDPEGVRLMVLSSARSQLIKTGNPLAYKAIKCLDEPFYDRASGHALLAAGCYQVVHGKG